MKGYNSDYLKKIKNYIDFLNFSYLGIIVFSIFLAKISFLSRPVHAQVGNYVVNYNYDESFSTNGNGRLTSVSDPSGSTSFYYDSMGSVTRTDKTVNGTTYKTQTSFDIEERVSSITYPDNDVVYYHYDNASNLDQVYQNPTTPIILAQYSGFNALGQPATVKYNNQVTTNFSYSNLANTVCSLQNSRLCTINTTSSTGSTLQNLVYTYTGKGNIFAITDAINGSQSYAYDELDRLVSASGPYGSINYAYNEIGNMVCNSQISSPCSATQQNYLYPNSGPGSSLPHAVIHAGTIAPTYDLNGNMTSRGSYILGYDPENRLSSVTTSTGSSTTTMVYDGSGGRVSKTSNGTTTIYIGKLYECTGTTCYKYVFAGNNRIAVKAVTGGGIWFYHTDQLASSSVMTDSTGAIAETIKYYPYGQLYYDTGAISTPYKYTGQYDDYYDPSTSFYFYGARYYDPVLGRFISADTVIPDGSNPQTLNRYSYVNNNPILLTDPNGHCPWCIIAAAVVIGALIGGAESDWNPRAMLIGGVIGGLSGGAGSFVGGWAAGAADSVFVGSVLGGEVSGMVAGGLNAAFNGGDMLLGISMGMSMGMIGGAAFGGISEYYGDNWTWDRALVQGTAGGLVNEAGGGDFKTGFEFSGGSALAMTGYDYMKEDTNTSSLNTKIRHKWLSDGELNTQGVRPCEPEPNCPARSLLEFGSMKGEDSAKQILFGGSYDVDSGFGHYINTVSKVHDFFNSWGYNPATGNYVAGGLLYNTVFDTYSMIGMPIAAGYTSFAYSALNYQPLTYIYSNK